MEAYFSEARQGHRALAVFCCSTKGCMKKTLLILVVVTALNHWVVSASAHLVAHHPKNATLRQIESSQKQNLAHARYVCNHGAHQEKRWSCHATKWLTRELKETKAVLHPTRMLASASTHTGGYQGIEAIKFAKASCESGGDPYNKHNPKYRGKWQFDQSTWDAYAPSGYRGMDPADAPESIQDAAALAVTYDAWPNC